MIKLDSKDKSLPLFHSNWEAVKAMPPQGLKLENEFLDLVVLQRHFTWRIASTPINFDEGLFGLEIIEIEREKWWLPAKGEQRWEPIDLTSKLKNFVGDCLSTGVTKLGNSIVRIEVEGMGNKVSVLPSELLTFGVRVEFTKI